MLKKRYFKTKNSKYELAIGERDEALVIKDVVSVFDNPNHAGYTRVISTSLRHGVPVQYLVEQMQKDKESDLFSFSKVIARCLKNYIVDGTVASDKASKTLRVEIERRFQHRKYGKIVRARTVCHVHDEEEQAAEGDVVEIVECPPRSKTKRWDLVRIVKKATDVSRAAGDCRDHAVGGEP